MFRHAITIAFAIATAILAAPSIASAQSAPSAGGFTGNPLVSNGQHLIAGGNPPAASAGCGTGNAIIGTDTAGHIVSGTSTSQPCTLTFSQPFVNRPSCIVTSENATVSYTITALAIAITSLIDGNRYHWICFARAGG